ncbi:unnamed protein product [Penicillium pancosmium]
MAARISRHLPLLSRRGWASLPSHATPRLVNTSARCGLVTSRNTRNLAPWTGRATPAKSVAVPLRYAHTDASSSGRPKAVIADATAFKGSNITEKHWTSQNLPVADPLIEPQAVLHFLEFITSGILPNGKKTDLPLLNPDEFPLFLTPSSQWAPAPFNKDETLSSVQKAIKRITDAEEVTGLCLVGQNIQFIKNRLWGGLAPVPASRWREKDLNNPDHFAIAQEYLTSVVAVFEYLNNPQIRSNMRDTFNKISGDFGEMQEALNAQRKAAGGVSPDLNLTGLWEEYIRSVYEVMTTTAHSWVLARVTELRARTLDSFSEITAKPNAEESPEMAIFSQRWSELLSVTSMADFNIWISMEGYNGFKTPTSIVAGLHNPDLQNQATNSGFSELLLERLGQCIKRQNEAAGVSGEGAIDNDAARRERLSISTLVQDEIREKIRGPTPSPRPPVQPWIQQHLRAYEMLSSGLQPGQEPDFGFGLAIYRAAHRDISDEQWNKLKQDLETQFSAWGEEVERADELKPLLKLHWFDCKELGFDAANSITEARSHFQQIRTSEEWSRKIAPSFFLVIDPMAVGSYTDENFQPTATKDEVLLKGDFQGHVLAIDADFEAPAPADASKEADPTKYTGQMRVLGNLVWSEIYPMLMLQSANLETLNMRTRDHPMKVYTGPTVPSQVGPWKERNAMKGAMMDSFVDYLKEKNPELAGKVEGMKGQGIL